MNAKKTKTLQTCIENVYNRADLMLVCVKNFDLERLRVDAEELAQDVRFVLAALKRVENETAKIKVEDLLS